MILKSRKQYRSVQIGDPRTAWISNFFSVLVRFGPRTRTKPLGPGPTGFGPWISGSDVEKRSKLETLYGRERNKTKWKFPGKVMGSKLSNDIFFSKPTRYNAEFFLEYNEELQAFCCDLQNDIQIFQGTDLKLKYIAVKV